jgi:hypothetical protein
VQHLRSEGRLYPVLLLLLVHGALLGAVLGHLLVHVYVDVRDEPPLLCLFHLALPLPPQVLDKRGQGQPLGGVHVDVVAVADELVVYLHRDCGSLLGMLDAASLQCSTRTFFASTRALG